MKLYIYEHCPFCAKVTLFSGIKGVSLELVVLASDDEKTPISMIGQKSLPILEKSEGSYMGESMDIIHYLDNIHETPILVGEETEQSKQWVSDLFPILLPLFYPRITKIGLKEFETQSALDYFNHKKEPTIGSYEASLARTDELINQVELHLGKLSVQLNCTEQSPFYHGQKISIDDLNVFGFLRCLTVVKGLSFPDKVNQYLRGLSPQ